jgi:hypothetical protein
MSNEYTGEYGDTRNPQFHADLDEEQNTLAYEHNTCRYCKTAKRKAGEAWDASPHEAHPDHIGELRKNGRTRVEVVKAAGCRKYIERRHLNYVTSPASETYWTS